MRLLMLPALIAALVLLSATPTTIAGGTTLTVTKTDDTFDGVCDDDCSLRDAVFVANSSGDENTINLGAGTYAIISAAVGFGDFGIDSPVIIVGQGPETTIVDGGSFDTVFTVTSGGSLTLEGVKVTHGNAVIAGGISASGALAINNSAIVENMGGIVGGVRADILSIRGSLIEGNIGQANGGVQSVTTDIRDTEITNNTASTEATGVGGLNVSGDLVLRDVRIVANSATGTRGAGGLYTFAFAPVSTSGVAGDPSVDAERVEITNNTFTTAALLPAGTIGPVAAGGWQNQLPVTATDIDVSGNDADGTAAGGLGHTGQEAFVLNRGGINLNTAATGAGGAYFLGPADLTNVTISNNIAQGTSPGLVMDSGPIVASTIATNSTTAVEGAGLVASQDVTITGSILAENEPLNCFNGLGGDLLPVTTGFNLEDGNSCEFLSPGDIQDTNPLLGALHDNGGDAGLSRNLPEESPAIDAWSAGCPPPNEDHRRQERPSGDACDIGAFEREVINAIEVTWGDNDCNFGVQIEDAGAILVFLADIEFQFPQPVGAPFECPALNESIFSNVYANVSNWGDIDCSGQIDGADALYILWVAAGIEAFLPANQCPVVGEVITIE